MNVLFTSDIILDHDTGIIKTIYNNFNDDVFFNMNMLERMANNIFALKYTLVQRKELNPISTVVRDNFKNNIDKIYNQLWDQYSEDIINNSIFTEVERLLSTTSHSTSILPIVMCKNSYEEKLIKEKYKVGTIISEDYSCDASHYDAIYTKSYETTLKFKNLSGNNIYIGNVLYNFEKNNKTPLLKVSVEINNANKINIINIYYLEKPVG